MFGNIIFQYMARYILESKVDKIQNILLRLSNLNFSKNCSTKHVFILGGTNNVDHNSTEEIANGLITSGIFFTSTMPKC